MEAKQFQIPVTMDKGTPKINIDELLSDEQFRAFAAEQIANEYDKSDCSCVVFLSYRNSSPLCQLVNLLAERYHSEPKPLALATKKLDDVYNMRHLKSGTRRILLVKKVFRTGSGLEDQIQSLTDHGFDVSVLCLAAHSSQDVQSFSEMMGKEVKVLFSLDKVGFK